MAENRRPMSLREGKAYLDGVEILDCLKVNIKFTPDVWSGKQIGDSSTSRKWLGYTITGTISERRSTAWLKDAVQKYIDSGETPELTIQGLLNDKNSDYYDANGTVTVTAKGCVLTGDINLIDLDSGGDVVTDEIAFGAKSVV